MEDEEALGTAAPPEEAILRILIATDNHLGVWEKDELRKNDSFKSFEEILQLAVQQNVDMILLGGDLFHDNKPTRNTLVRSIDLITKYCLTDKQVPFQVVSDPAQNFANGRVNFQDPNLNIGIPIFTIHGNHDDPAGTENLSAVDILSSSGLINYFGKVQMEGSGIGKIKISPVLIQKGNTKLALYGLGNLRDERLGRMFQTPGCVEWARPEDSPEFPMDEWFNLMVLHQNRIAHAANAKNYIKESYLARFLDFVVWGHEHECVCDPWESAQAQGAAFSLVQPGSSVATALSEGESKKKHVIMLEICGDDWRSIKFPLETVRPFSFETVALKEQIDLDPDEPESITRFLERKVEQMIRTANMRRTADQGDMLPLIRLRVDYSGFSTINTQRFGQHFVGKVANPNDVLLWQKAAARRVKKNEDGSIADGGELAARPEAADEKQIEDLIQEHLVENLEILPERELAFALHDFVEKDEKQALAECLRSILSDTQVAALGDESAEDLDQADTLAALLHLHAQQRRDTVHTAPPAATRRPNPPAGQQRLGAVPNGVAAAGRPPRGPAAASQGASRAANGASAMDIDDGAGIEDSDDEGIIPRLSSAAPRTAPAPAAAAARGRRGRQSSIGEAFGHATSRAAANAPSPSERGSTQQSAAGRRGRGRGRASAAATPTPPRQSSRSSAARTKERISATRDANGLDKSGSDAADDLDEEDAVEDSDDEIELVQEPASTGHRQNGSARPAAASVLADTQQTNATAQPTTAAGSQIRSFRAPVSQDKAEQELGLSAFFLESSWQITSWKHRLQKQLLYEQSVDAWHSGDRALAKRLSNQAKAEAAAMKLCNQQAAAALLRANNEDRGRPLHELDLHGLHIDEAILAVQERVRHIRGQTGRGTPASQLVCIVGRGLHSNNRKSKLAPAVTRLALDMQLGITADKPHVGCLLIDCHPPKHRIGFFDFLAEKCTIM
ncbi:hypothetical protein WJX74_005353 [Apatococcus lobatus]|uniref:Smr domain-containing protein n=1 Tax=Apatococcus lobatus TaxID=904363 RepID=A0AAW1SGB0_9CHLO